MREIISELMGLFGISVCYLALVFLLLISILGRSAFPEGNLIDIMVACFDGQWSQP